jgi:hypothetical protein
MVHQIIAPWHFYPKTRILCFPWDYKSAYWRLHYDTKAAKCVWHGSTTNYSMCLHLTFGSAGNLPAWCAISELQADLAKDIFPMHRGGYLTWQTKISFYNLQEIERPPDDVPYAKAESTMVLLPPRAFGSCNIFLDGPDGRRQENQKTRQTQGNPAGARLDSQNQGTHCCPPTRKTEGLDARHQ